MGALVQKPDGAQARPHTTSNHRSDDQDGKAPGDVEIEDDIYTIITPRNTSRRANACREDEPLVDLTAALKLRSKKTERLQKKLQKKTERATVRSEVQSFLELPPELLQEVLGHLTPREVLNVRRLNRATFDFIQRNQQSIATNIIRQRYWVLTRSFPLPVPFSDVDPSDQSSILSKAWQDRITIHKNPYQHIRRFDTTRICTCTSCVLAWNNLCVILDLAYFQRNLEEREPIPMIARGSWPEWNEDLINQNARIVEDAVSCPLVYASILEKHLSTIVRTLTRKVRVGKRTFTPRQLYRLSKGDVDSGTDEFLERQGDPSYQFPYHRDNYYSLEAYVPNRKWSRELHRWQYISPRNSHEKDLALVVRWYKPDPVQIHDVSPASHSSVEHR